MASQRITRVDVFPEGTSVAAYPLANWSQAQLPPAGAPIGAAEGTAGTVTGGVATITGLTPLRNYVAYALVAGEHRYVRFTAPATGVLDQDELITPSDRGAAYASGTVVANQGRIGRFVLAHDVTIAGLAFAVVTAAAADDPFAVAIYPADLSAPILSTGARTSASPGVSGGLNSAGRKTVTGLTPTLLRAGVPYYSALSMGALGGAAAALATKSWVNSVAARLAGTAAGVMSADSITGAHPLSGALTPTNTGGAAFAIYLIEA